MTSVLITGGTGSFGKRFALECLRREWSRIAVYARSEHIHQEMEEKFEDFDNPFSPAMRYFVGDVRDRDRLRMAMRGVKYVVHAAALKVVPMMEANPTEAVMTNVMGTLNVIHAAMDAEVEKVVLLSTDKACEPANLYGATKLTAEKMVLSAAASYTGASGPKFAVVRYGNIAGSRGSVIPKWREMSGAVPITDPNATRYWMTLDQAVDLVMWTLEHMIGGETVIPDMPRFYIGDLAKAMGLQAVEIGMRPGEKKHETIITKHEAPDFRPLIERIAGGLMGYIRGGDHPFLMADDPVVGPVMSSDAGHMSWEVIAEKLSELD